MGHVGKNFIISGNYFKLGALEFLHEYHSNCDLKFVLKLTIESRFSCNLKKKTFSDIVSRTSKKRVTNRCGGLSLGHFSYVLILLST